MGSLSVPQISVNMGSFSVPGKSLSVVRTKEVVPKKLWGDRSESDDEGLPSPLAQIKEAIDYIDITNVLHSNEPVQEADHILFVRSFSLLALIEQAAVDLLCHQYRSRIS
jgi:hypothetical protein